ncbi:MAG: ATP-binding protein [Variovorax sp.]
MEAVGQLTGGIAHDFNNLLQGVAGSLDLIRHKPDDAARVRRWAEAGLAAAERGAKLTGQLLAFSRSQKLEQKPVVVATLVLNMRDLLNRTLGPSVRVSFDLEPDALRVLGDETQLEMAVLNLAINARDAMPQGGELTIATRRCRVDADPEVQAGDYVALSVADTGCGMAPDVAARAFDPFFTTKGIGKGTGLGLSQVYGMVRQAGGTVRIHSRPGAGTTIRLLLRCTGMTAALADANAAGKIDGMPRSATVLVVDDDPDVRRFLADSLDALGYRALEAEDGPAGIAALDRFGPDAMIVDFAMPGMTGAEVAREAHARRPALPIIFASGFSETAAIEEVAGKNTPILRKPFRVDELHAALVDALRRAAENP